MDVFRYAVHFVLIANDAVVKTCLPSKPDVAGVGVFGYGGFDAPDNSTQ